MRCGAEQRNDPSEGDRRKAEKDNAKSNKRAGKS